MEEKYNIIKNELVNTEIRSSVKEYYANKIRLEGYFNVGKILREAGKHYGEGIIGKFAIKLQSEIGRKYNERTLRRYRQFYEMFKDQKWSPLGTKLSWSHYRVLLPLKDINEINYYIKLVEEQNLTKRGLEERIKSKEYERLPEGTKNKLKDSKEVSLVETIKEPIIIKNTSNDELLSEKVLKEMILNNIEDFMNELGSGFCFIGSEYKIKIGNRYNYIDILLYNIIYHCYVVIELKITELKSEHIGQIEKYMGYIDDNISSIYENKTVGIILVRRNNEYLVEYISDKRILSKEYLLK